MTDIAFHFNIAEPLTYLGRLLRKAHRAGAQVVVLADSGLLTGLSTALWENPAAAFLPHCLAASASPACLAASPVVLTEQLQGNNPSADVLVNLQHPVPNGFAQFSRLIEIVSLHEADKMAARERWRLYASRGYPLIRHDSRLESASSSTA